MKKALEVILILTTVAIFADESECYPCNGGFEKINTVSKEKAPYANAIKKGSYFGDGPDIRVPASWEIIGTGKMFVNEADGNKNNPDVKEGKYSVTFQGNSGTKKDVFGAKASYPQKCPGYPVGKYKLTFWYKGSGKISFGVTFFKLNENRGEILAGGKGLISNLKASDEWTHYEKEFDIVNEPQGAKGFTLYFTVDDSGPVTIDNIVLTIVAK